MSLLSIKSVTKRFGGLCAVQDLSFEIQPGEIVAIFGPNGSGKTTLLNLVAGLLPLTSGTLAWQGLRVERLSTHRRSALGIVKTFQNPLLFGELSVEEHLRVATHLRYKRALGCGRLMEILASTAAVRCAHRQASERVEQVLGLCRLELRRHAQAESLSYGEEKMLGVAMALMCEPRLLLLDEPASGLGQDEISSLDGVLRDLRTSGLTLCIIDHKVDFLAQLADRALALVNGSALAMGSPQEVLAHPRVVEAYLGMADA